MFSCGLRAFKVTGNAQRTMHSSESIADHNISRSCVFCGIVQKIHPDSKKILYEDDDIVVFPDIKPSAVVHLQVVSKKHIKNIDELLPRDHHLVESMLRIGKEQVEKIHPDASYKFGFHKPPWNSVLHLHMHAFVLPHTNALTKWKYVDGSAWWLNADSLIERLKEGKN